MNAPARTGLDPAIAAQRLADEGPNDIGVSQRRTLPGIAKEVASEPMFLLLLAAGTVYLLMGDTSEALVLMGFVLVIMGLTIMQERRTDAALAALRDLSSPRALVIRNGIEARIAGRDVVRGDLLILGEGDRVPADGQLLETHDLSIDESMLTGESLPIPKAAGDTVSAGTLIVQGQGVAEVRATGMHTDMGRIGASLGQIDVSPSPLREEMSRLTRRFAVAGLAVACALVLAYWLLRGDLPQAILAGIALAMSVLPQEFPVIMIIFFAFAARRLARADVLTRRLDAIETLGQTSVLCVDKTGTLTQNRMDVVALQPAGPGHVRAEVAGSLSEAQHMLLLHALLASETEPHDAMEKAIHRLAAAGDRPQRIEPHWKLVREYELSPELPAMTHAWDLGDTGIVVAIKGAPEAVAALCGMTDDLRRPIAREAEAFADCGLRVLGVARARHPHGSPWPGTPRGFAFEWLGLVALADPLRAEVPSAIAQCGRAGIRVVMITGDHPRTALAIAREAGISATRVLTGSELAALAPDDLAAAVREVNVFARVKPQQKLMLVEALKARREVVAMTGDGVNDAPALKAAHIGVAMGQRGTDVAREAGALVLLKDDFGSIVSAIRMGRRTFANMRQAMVYTVAVHVPIIGLSLLPLIFGLPLMLMPLHIAFLELVIDPACSVVFEAEDGDESLMQQPPRRQGEPLLPMRDALQSLAYGTLTTAAAFAAYALLLDGGKPAASAAASAFVLLVVTNAVLILPSRSRERRWQRLWSGLPGISVGVMAATVAGLWVVTMVPAIAPAFRFTPLTHGAWALSALGGVMMLGLFQMAKLRS